MSASESPSLFPSPRQPRSAPPTPFANGHASAGDRFARWTPFGPVVLRAGLGVVFLAHAYAKAFIFTFAGTRAFFAAHGFPGWTVMPVFLAEALGGLTLLLGFQVRLASLGLLVVMMGALKPHLANGWSFMAPGGGWEYPAFIVAALSAQVLLGAGAAALRLPFEGRGGIIALRRADPGSDRPATKNGRERAQ